MAFTTSNKERSEYQRISEIEAYFAQQKAPDMTLIGLAIIIGLYLNPLVASLIIGLSLLKMLLLLVYSVVERKAYDASSYPVSARASQFWLYRFIFLLQVLLLVWILFQVLMRQLPPPAATAHL